MRVPFVKMEGAGNDYVFVDAIRTPLPPERAPELARAWSDRHFGIGSDGLILLQPGEGKAVVRMAMWNADGSRGAMCGNGLRCLAKFARDHGHVRLSKFAIATDAGARGVVVVRDDGAVAIVRADMGSVAVAAAAETVHVAGREVTLRAGDAGNPHAVVFVEDAETAPVAELGAALQRHPRFPGGVNVEFVQVLADGSVRQRTYERGSGETLACGTGAAVAALAAVAEGRLQGTEVTVRLRGGVLRALLGDGNLVIEGPARTVFRGDVDVPAP